MKEDDKDFRFLCVKCGEVFSNKGSCPACKSKINILVSWPELQASGDVPGPEPEKVPVNPRADPGIVQCLECAHFQVLDPSSGEGECLVLDAPVSAFKMACDQIEVVSVRPTDLRAEIDRLRKMLHGQPERRENDNCVGADNDPKDNAGAPGLIKPLRSRLKPIIKVPLVEDK